MKRYCQTLTLVDNPEMIEKYVEVHKHVWPEIIPQRPKSLYDYGH
jgi:L-rhamnose mutarotase